MFVKYEKSFKKLLKLYHETGERVFSSYNLDVPIIELQYLAAHGFLELTPYVQEIQCKVKISDRGLIYFDLKRDKLFRFWIPVSISIIALFRPELEKFILSLF